MCTSGTQVILYVSPSCSTEGDTLFTGALLLAYIVHGPQGPDRGIYTHIIIYHSSLIVWYISYTAVIYSYDQVTEM